MSTLWSESSQLAIGLQQQYLATLDPVDLGLDFVAVLEVEVVELKFVFLLLDCSRHF